MEVFWVQNVSTWFCKVHCRVLAGSWRPPALPPDLLLLLLSVPVLATLDVVE